jgi:spore germination protein KC
VGVRRSRLILVLLCLVAFLCAGCWDRTELEDQAFIIFMGIDREETGALLVTAEVTQVQGVVHGQARFAAKILTARARTITEAIHILNAGMSRGLTLKHLRGVLIGESLSRKGVEPVLMELLRNPITRGSVWLAQARGRAFDIVMKFTPVSEFNPGQATEGLILQTKRYHLAPPGRMQNFLNRLASAGGDPYLPAEGVNPGATGEGKGEEPKKGPEKSALPGELPRGGGNPMELVGTAVFVRDRLVGFLTVDETQMLLALRGEMGKAYVTFPDPTAPNQVVTMRFHLENKPKRRAFFQGKDPVVQVHLLFEGEVLAAPSGQDYVPAPARAKLEAAAAAHATKTIRELLTKLNKWGADPAGFGYLFRGRFATYKDWEAYNWRAHVRDLKVEASARMRIRRYGIYTGPDRVWGGR